MFARFEVTRLVAASPIRRKVNGIGFSTAKEEGQYGRRCFSVIADCRGLVPGGRPVQVVDHHNLHRHLSRLSFQVRTATRHHSVITRGPLFGLDVVCQTEPFDYQITEHLPELLLRRIARHRGVNSDGSGVQPVGRLQRKPAWWRPDRPGYPVPVTAA